MIRNHPQHFDTSNFAKENPFNIVAGQNRKKPGVLAIENAKFTLKTIVFLVPKVLTLLYVEPVNPTKINLVDATSGNHAKTNSSMPALEIKKAKGISKSVIKGFTFSDYIKILETRTAIFSDMYRLASKKHLFN